MVCFRQLVFQKGFLSWARESFRHPASGLKQTKPKRTQPPAQRRPDQLSLAFRAPGLKGLQLVQAFVQLDISAPGIRDKRERNPQIRARSIGHIELDPGGFSLLAKRLQVLDLETDMVESPAFSSYCWSVGFRERQVHARQIRRLELPSLAWLGAERL